MIFKKRQQNLFHKTSRYVALIHYDSLALKNNDEKIQHEHI